MYNKIIFQIDKKSAYHPDFKTFCLIKCNGKEIER